MKIDIEIDDKQLHAAVRKHAQESLFEHRAYRYDACGELKTLVESAVQDAVVEMRDAILAAAKRHATVAIDDTVQEVVARLVRKRARAVVKAAHDRGELFEEDPS